MRYGSFLPRLINVGAPHAHGGTLRWPSSAAIQARTATAAMLLIGFWVTTEMIVRCRGRLRSNSGLCPAMPNARVNSAPPKTAEEIFQEFFHSIVQVILVEISAVVLKSSSCHHFGPGHSMGQRIRDETAVNFHSSNLTAVIFLWTTDSQLPGVN